MAGLPEGVVNEIERLLESMGVELVEAQLSGTRRGRILRVTIYRPEGVDLDLCTQVSELLSSLLDELDPIEGSYVLEVSSPGLERPLKTVRDFERALGATVKLKTEEGSVIKGVLVEAGPSGCKLRTESGEVDFEYSHLRSARTIFEW